jgi:hypothetical protein
MHFNHKDLCHCDKEKLYSLENDSFYEFYQVKQCSVIDGDLHPLLPIPSTKNIQDKYNFLGHFCTNVLVVAGVSVFVTSYRVSAFVA